MEKGFYKSFVDCGYGNPEYEEVFFTTEDDAFEEARITLENIVSYGAEKLDDEDLLEFIENEYNIREDIYSTIIENGLEEEYPKTFAYLLEEIH